jgi:AcrR family transcriptional regulator
MTTAAGVRARNRAAIEAEILRVGREHLARHGAAALSLRAVARELGMVSSAVYRYVDSRDELLTRLIVSAYDALGDEVEAALAALPVRASADRRFRTIWTATRAWARAHPHEYALLYGSPVPGYHAPSDRTVAPGTRVQAHLLGLLGALTDPALETARDRRAMGPQADALLAGVPAGALRRGLASWNLVMGSISAEVFEQHGPDTIADPDAFFAAVLDDALALVGG